MAISTTLILNLMSRGVGSRQWAILQACVLESELYPTDSSQWWIDLRTLLTIGHSRSEWISLQRAARRLSVTGGWYYKRRELEYRGGRRGLVVRLKPPEQDREKALELHRRLAALYGRRAG